MELQKDTQWMRHTILEPKPQTEYNEHREKINYEIQQQARYLWSLQQTNKQLFEIRMREAPLAVKKCLEQLGFVPSKHQMQQANRVVGESALSGQWLIVPPKRAEKYTSTQAHTNALLTQQQLGVT